MTRAFLFMDFQEGICRPAGRLGAGDLADEIARRDVLGKASAFLCSVRQRGEQVIHVRVAFDAAYSLMTSASPRFAMFRANQLMIDGTEEARICAEVAPVAGEATVTKGCVNPFVGTALTSLLLARAVNSLVLAGVATNHVVEGTARFAADCGYGVTVAEDLCAAPREQMHRFSIEHILPSYGAVRTSSEILAEL